MRINDRYIYLALAILSAYLLYLAQSFVSEISYDSLGASTFPILIMSLLLITLIVLVLQKASFYTDWNLSKKQAWSLVCMILILLAYAILFVPLGFILSTILCMSLSAVMFGAHPIDGIIGATSMSLYSYLLFDRVFDVILPLGPLVGIFS